MGGKYDRLDALASRLEDGDRIVRVRSLGRSKVIKVGRLTPRRLGGGLRKECAGWTVGVSRRCQDTLGRLDLDRLPDWALFGGLTVRDCPPTPEAWQRLVKVFVKNERRHGLTHYVNVVEWQLREILRAQAAAAGLPDPGGVPHLHPLLFYERPRDPGRALEAWLRISAEFGTTTAGQQLAALRSREAGVRYDLKHGTRQTHEQRQNRNAPASWGGRTCRMFRTSRNLPLVPIREDPVETEDQVEALRRSLAYLAGVEAAQEVVGKRGRDRPADRRREVEVDGVIVQLDAVQWGGWICDRIMARDLWKGHRQWVENEAFYELAIGAAGEDPPRAIKAVMGWTSAGEFWYRLD